MGLHQHGKMALTAEIRRPDLIRSGPSAVSPILAKAPRYRRGLASVHGERLSARRARGRCRDSTRSLRLTVSRKPKEREVADEFAEPLDQVLRRRVVLLGEGAQRLRVLP